MNIKITSNEKLLNELSNGAKLINPVYLEKIDIVFSKVDSSDWSIDNYIDRLIEKNKYTHCIEFANFNKK